MYKVRAEIVGEFVTVEKFENIDDAIKYCDKLQEQGIYDSVDMWKI